MIKFRKTVSKFGKIRRIIEVPKEYYDVVKVGNKVMITVIENVKRTSRKKKLDG